MKIDGKAIADKILEDLTLKVSQIKGKGIVPTLAVILIGDNPASLSYIKQKQKTAERIGALLKLFHLPISTPSKDLTLTIQQCNNDSGIHGIIVQRPLPKESNIDVSFLNTVSPHKDVDGFIPNSPFTVPVARAVGELLKNAKCQMTNAKYDEPNTNPDQEFLEWLRKKNIVIIGRGETAGKPIANYLVRQQCTTSTIHSHTADPDEIIRNADIVISCVGKSRVVTKYNIKRGSTLLSVGIWRDSEGKLHGDYEEEEIADTASFYTPTPGGVGPVNVACLMQNLGKASII